MKKTVLWSVILLIFSTFIWSDTIWNEDFNDLNNGVTLSSSITEWDNVRVGTDGGPIEAKNPSSFDASSSMILGASLGASITVVSAYDLDMDPDIGGSQLSTIFTLSFDVKFTGYTGDFYVFIGDGDRYSGNYGFTYATTLIGIKWDLPSSGSTINMQNCDAEWLTVDPIDNFDFEIGSTYRVAIVGNMSGSSYDYTAETVANDKYDLWVDSGSGWVLRLDDVVLNSDQILSGIDSFRFYGINGADADIELDDVKLLNVGDPTLPVVLSSFTAQYLNNVPTLYWQTQSETNNAGWNIYRGETNEALSNEEAYLLNLSLGLIPGAGTTSEPTEYSFEDFFPVYQETTYFYWLESVDYSGETESYGPISLTIPEDEWENPNSPEIPKNYGLHQNYPNPFNPSTEISFMMKENCIAELSVYNIKGEKVSTLFQNKSVSKDELIRVYWDGKDNFGQSVSSGIYLYNLRTNKENYTRRMILMK